MSEVNKTEYQALGMMFILLGFSLTMSLGVILDPAFFGVGLPFAFVGGYLLYTAQKCDEDGGE